MRVVLDTNTIVSAIGWDGAPWTVLRAIREGPQELVTTVALLAELNRVLSYPRLSVVRSRPRLRDVLEWLHHPRHLAYPQETVNVFREDDTDNRVLEAAASGKADVIVSGDGHLLARREFRGIPIVSAAEFVARYLTVPGR